MTKRMLLTMWGGLFIVCAALGFIPEPEGGAAVLLTLFSLLFFVPPAVLLYRADRNRDTDCIALIRNLSCLSLILTAVVLSLNFLSAMGGEFVGNVLYYLLVIVSSPMICSGYWVLSLFLWACLLSVSRKLFKKCCQ